MAAGDIKVLIIDDDQQILNAMSSMLKLNGFIPYSSASGKQGLQKALEIKPDVILLDVWLPDIDGLSVCNSLKNSPETGRIPVILVTGDETLSAEKSLAGLGHERIVKPIDPSRLVSTIMKLVNKAQSPAVLAADERKRILIVDDDRQICDMLKNALTRKGYNAETLYDGNNISDFVKKTKPDIIFLDFTFPTGPNGIEVCRILKTNPETKSVPIIMMTANEDVQSVDKCFELGADDYIFKPFSLVDLLLRIKKYQVKRGI